MTKNRIFYPVAAVMLTMGGVYTWMQGNSDYSPRKNEFNYRAAAAGKGFTGAAEWHKMVKANPQTGLVDLNDVFAAERAVEALAKAKNRGSLNLSWLEMGPSNVGGRTRAFLADTACGRYYAGGVTGGLWYSDNEGGNWHKVSDQLENLAVNSITRAANGDIYYGTGEGHANPYGSVVGSGAIGRGVFKSTNACTSAPVFSSLDSTNPSVISNSGNSSGHEWAYVYDLIAHPTNPDIIYAGNGGGLRVSVDGGVSWKKDYITTGQGNPLGGVVDDMELGSDGSLLVVLGNKIKLSPDGSKGSFVDITPTALGSVGRIDAAIAPSNANIIYLVVASGNGKLGGVWVTENKGVSWHKIGEGSAAVGGTFVFEPFGSNSQGWYDNIGYVNPSNPGEFYLGGVELWRWKKVNLNPISGEWVKISAEFPDSPFNEFYVHSDKHGITTHPGNPNRLIIATDGGMFQSKNRGFTYYPQNRNYNITQFYSISFSGTGEVLGGTQDNGTQYIQPHIGSDAVEVSGGDGGHTAISQINNDFLFTTVYYGSLSRSDDRGGNSASFYSTALDEALTGGSFVTPIRLWESFNDPLSPDSTYIWNKTDQAIPSGTTMEVASLTNGYLFTHTLNSVLAAQDSVLVPDPVQAQLAFGITSAAGGEIWLNVNPLSPAENPAWIRLATIPGTPQTLTFSPDGNTLFAGNLSGGVWRISGLSGLRRSDMNTNATSIPAAITSTQIGSFGSGRAVNDIAVDPNNPNHVIVVLGAYGSSDYIYRSTNAMNSTDQASTGWTAKGGSGFTALPKMPVYSAVIDVTDGKRVILGTEYGIYSTSNISAPVPQWADENASFPRVPVYMIRQQTLPNNWERKILNEGVIYAATHGRGIWQTKTLAAPDVSVEENKPEPVSSFRLYPNPAVNSTSTDMILGKSQVITVRIFDLKGRLVAEENFGKLSEGSHKLTLNTSALTSGTYLVSVQGPEFNQTSRLSVVK